MYLLDTNVVSEIRKIRTRFANPRVIDWAERMYTRDLFLSAITIEELEVGVLQMERRDAPQGAALRAWINDSVLPTFFGRILAIDLAIAQQSAGLHVPNPRPVRDAFIAATALVHELTVVTRNVADFEPMGVKVLNPWLG